MQRYIFTILSIFLTIILYAETAFKNAEKLYRQGNYKEAYYEYEKICLKPNNYENNVTTLTSAYSRALTCLRQINKMDKVDAFREKVIKIHKNNWKLLSRAAKSYLHEQYHYGYMISGEFKRGNHRGGGQRISSLKRDRTRALQLYKNAFDLIQQAKITPSVKYIFLMDFADAISIASNANAWKLQNLTDLSKLPDYEKNRNYGFGYMNSNNYSGAPVTENGIPIYYNTPKSFNDAKNDGERWHFLLNSTKKCMPKRTEPDMQWARFVKSQFSVRTMKHHRFQINSEKTKKENPFAVHTLQESETIAKLATGIKRFSLPEEHNYIKIYKKISEGTDNNAEQALHQLAEIFTDRRQYKKAAKYWKESIERFKKISKLFSTRMTYKEKKLNQIVNNWCQFEDSTPSPAGKNAKLSLTFRNGSKVAFTATKINTELLINDIKKHLKSNPKRIDYEKIQINRIGYRIIRKNEKKYLRSKAVKWEKKIIPLKNHFDKQITIKTPIKDAGAYLITAKMQNGNTSRIVLWLTDTVIIEKKIDKAKMYFVSDAVTGKPISHAKLNLFGYKSEYIRNPKRKRRHYKIKTSQSIIETNNQGLATIDKNNVKNNYQWIISTKNKNGTPAYMGFRRIWFGNNREFNQYSREKAFIITDRPVYRPEQTVKFKLWMRKADYTSEDSFFANKTYTVSITDPKGTEILKKNMTTDDYGAFDSEFELPEDATLGTYRLYIKNRNGIATFRVEEYKKPEFKVSVNTPKKTVKLGETISATIKAEYYFGGTVKNAKIKYKVQRYKHEKNWYPPTPWDWLYSPGYWWFAYDYEWYPGWKNWGCRRPFYSWIPHSTAPPETIINNEIEIGQNGTVEIKIDTSVANQLFGGLPQRYVITAEVTDHSRRTIVGTGNIIASKSPFKVTVWTNKGFYRVGENINASAYAASADNKPIKGNSITKLFKIRYEQDGTPHENLIQKWSTSEIENGNDSQIIKAAEPGQYRISFSVTDNNKETEEGAQIFTVRGEKIVVSPDDFRFNDIEIICDKKNYAPGDTAEIMINTAVKDSTVLLFLRPSNGYYYTPKIIHIKGKTWIENIDIQKKDMPNIFVEAITVRNGKIHTATKEITIPPEKRIINVEVIPSEKRCKPGKITKIKVKLSDPDANPIKSDTVVSIYDKSIEYISGGSNIPNISKFFWKWKRNHTPNIFSNLNKYFRQILKKNEIGMSPLGVFGHLLKQDAEMEKLALGGGREMERTKGRQLLCASAVAECKSVGLANDSLAADSVRNLNKKEAPKKIHIRTNFADSAFWAASLKPSEDGIVEIECKMPEDLTTWVIKTWSLTHGTRVGQGKTEIITSKDIIVRLQAPRFFVESDTVTLSAIVHNYSDFAESAKVSIELGNDTLKLLDNPKVTTFIESKGEKRIDWRVKVLKKGKTKITMKAITSRGSDAMQKTFPVYTHGINKTVSFSGNIRKNKTFEEIIIEIPEKRDPTQSRLEIRYSPTLAGAMIDALPYLIDYPYGCTEQTINRFLPAVITRNILDTMNIDLATIKEKTSNLNAQEIGDDAERTKQWKRFKNNPIFDEGKLADVIAEGIKKLGFMQNADGGWGWFSGYNEYSYPHTTSIVVRGLLTAKGFGAEIPEKMFSDGLHWLKEYQNCELRKILNAPNKTKPCKTHADNMDAMVFSILTEADIKNNKMKEIIYKDRTKLSVYANATFALAMHKLKDNDKRDMIIRNIEQYLVRDKENQTAYLDLPNSGYWWYWYGSEIEAHAYYLKLLSEVEPLADKT
ncbi:MAG: MG2 domain-containing protein, partial [Verrucomicrobiota bacterium]|nr:MG2 domain-containing protein [Verrucomicrobiota bacterium]